MAIFQVIFDQDGQAIEVKKIANPSVFAPVTEPYAVFGFIKAVVEQSANSFKGLSIDTGFAVRSIVTSTALSREQKIAALDVLASFTPGDGFQFREQTKLFAIVTTGVPKLPPVIAVFVDP